MHNNESTASEALAAEAPQQPDAAETVDDVDVREWELDQLPHEVAAFESSPADLLPVPFNVPDPEQPRQLVAADELDVEGSLARPLELARAGLDEVVDRELVGDFVGAIDEGDGVYSLCFACKHDGYLDWGWRVLFSQLADEAEPTVLECALLPSDSSLVAPEWVPWAERLAEYSATHDRHGNLLEGADQEEAGAGSETRSQRIRTSSRTRTRRRLRRDREREAKASENPSATADNDDDELPVADDIREFAEERDQQLDGVESEEQ